MSQNSISKQIGATFLITGTVIGAGVLALPIVTAQLGFLFATAIMLFSWLVMTFTALLIADLSISMPVGTSFAHMAKKILGPIGAVISWVSFVFLMYSISVAYISAASSAFSTLLLNLAQQWVAIIFVVVFGLVVIVGTRYVDWVNRLLIVSKIIILVLVFIFFIPSIQAANLFQLPEHTGTAFALAFPVVITSFTSHIIVPTLSDYMHKDKKALARVIVWGSTIPLVLYIGWLISILGILPLHGAISFDHGVLNHASPNVGDVLNALNHILHTGITHALLNAFSIIAVVTSYLSVSLALYHFNVDSYRLHRLNSTNRILAATILTFILPLVINLVDPNLFLAAIGYVGVSVAILVVLLPVIMIMRQTYVNQPLNYQVSQSRVLWAISFFAGALAIILKLFFS